jgi:hypothetical protein
MSSIRDWLLGAMGVLPTPPPPPPSPSPAPQTERKIRNLTYDTVDPESGRTYILGALREDPRLSPEEWACIRLAQAAVHILEASIALRRASEDVCNTDFSAFQMQLSNISDQFYALQKSLNEAKSDQFYALRASLDKATLDPPPAPEPATNTNIDGGNDNGATLSADNAIPIGADDQTIR